MYKFFSRSASQRGVVSVTVVRAGNDTSSIIPDPGVAVVLLLLLFRIPVPDSTGLATMGLERELNVCSGRGGGTGGPLTTLCAPPGGGRGLECRPLGFEGKTTMANGSSSPRLSRRGLVWGAVGWLSPGA